MKPEELAKASIAWKQTFGTELSSFIEQHTKDFNEADEATQDDILARHGMSRSDLKNPHYFDDPL